MRRIVKPPDWLVSLLIAITLLIIAAIYLFKNTAHADEPTGYQTIVCGPVARIAQETKTHLYDTLVGISIDRYVTVFKCMAS
jgi:hypothetical protein